MQNLRVAVAQTAYDGSAAGMMNKLTPMIAEAAQEGAQVVCLPEFSLSPYFAGEKNDANFSYAESMVDGPSVRFFSAMAAEYGVYLVGSLYEKDADGNYWDTATIHAPEGALVGATRKVHIPAGTGYHENYYFKGYGEYPVFDIGALQIATPTCYDQWFPELARIYSMNGAEFIFYPSAIGSEPDAPDLDSKNAWQTVMKGNAIANGVYIGAANRIGTEGAVTFYGSSFICNPMGDIIAEAGRDTEEVIIADLDADLMARWRKHFPLMHQRVPQHYTRLLESDVSHEPPAWLRDEKS